MAASGAQASLRLVDHHVHGALTRELDHAGSEAALSQSSSPAPPGTSVFDSQLGFAVRRWCSPVLDLEPLAPAADYLRRRIELGNEEASPRLPPQTAAG